MTHDEMIAVIAAHRDGAAVEARYSLNGEWFLLETPRWTTNGTEYRIKPEPMVVWVNMYPSHVGGVYSSEAIANAASAPTGVARKFIEVIE